MSNRVVTYLLIIVVLQTTSDSWMIRSCTSKNSAVYVSNPLGDSGTPSVKDYIDLKIENQLNTVLNKIFDKIDTSAREIHNENKAFQEKVSKDIKEITEEIKELKKVITEDIDKIKKENNDIYLIFDVVILIFYFINILTNFFLECYVFIMNFFLQLFYLLCVFFDILTNLFLKCFVTQRR